MNIHQLQLPRLPVVAVLAAATFAHADPFDDWRYRHAVAVGEPGLIEIRVPAEALDAAREDGGDLRIADANQKETPYFRIKGEPGIVVDAPRFTPTLAPGKTEIEIAAPGDRPVHAVILTSPADRFLKAVRVESSDDRQSWSRLTEGAPVFRETNGAAQLRISFPATAAKFLRLTIDDSRTRAIPFSGARLDLAPDAPFETEAVSATIEERIEMPGHTRLELDFGVAHLPLVSIGLDSDDPLFARTIELIAPSIEGAEVRERRLGGGTAYRVAVDGAEPKSQLDVPLEVITPARRLTLRVENGDSPPLGIAGVRASTRVVRLRFFARAAGEFTLFAGNPAAGPPRYDLTALTRDLRGAEVTRLEVGPRRDNSAFSAAAQLPQIPLLGAALDPATWGYRKPVAIAAAGIQQLELDAQVLSRTGTRGADWRLLHGGKQVPFIVERPSFARRLVPEVSEQPDSKRPNVSRWEIRVPYEGLPATMLVCRTDAPLFDRAVALLEESRDAYGQTRVRTLGRARWVRTSKQPESELRLRIDARPETDRWTLEVENGDNAPIALRDFAVFQPAVRLLFKTGDATGLDFYYGNREAASPAYDLGLASAQLLRADRSVATLGKEEVLDAAPAGPRPIGGRPGIVFWVVLIVVVGGLLVFIAKLLPGTSADEA